MEHFQGLSEDIYRFFWEIGFQNEKPFFEANRIRYEENVKKPMYQLAAELSVTVLSIDPSLNVRPAAVVSRIRRDTRFSNDKTLYRDHMFLSYKQPGRSTGESFVLYAEFEREGYGYGMGMYCPSPQYMADVRKRILTRPGLFLSLAAGVQKDGRFILTGEDYKRPVIKDADEKLFPWLNKKKFSYCYFSADRKKTETHALVEEIKAGFHVLAPLYRFIQGIE